MTLSVLIIILAGILGLYAIVMSRTASQIPPSRQRWHLASFTLGLVVSLATFIPAPDIFGPDHRFTVNMAQMMFAVDLGPPLLLQGIPSVFLEPLLRWKILGRSPTFPILPAVLSTAILWGWFIPGLFEAASSNLTIWLLKQMLFLVSGLILWWPVAGTVALWKPNYPIQLVYMFVMRFPMIVLGISFSFANNLIYSARSFATELCAPSSLSDQLAGGIVMWTVGGLFGFAAFSIIFLRWFRASTAAERN